MLTILVLAGAPPISFYSSSLVGSPTWEISARMIPRYCLLCPRASMAAKNSFLSWISFTTAQRRGAINAQGSGRTQDLRPCMVSEPYHFYTHTQAHIRQTGPALELGPLAARGEPFSVPPCPSQWQRYFGVFVSLSPDLLWGPETILLMCRQGLFSVPISRVHCGCLGCEA